MTDCLIKCYLCDKDVSDCYFLYSYTYNPNEAKPIPISLYVSQHCKHKVQEISSGLEKCNFDGCEPKKKTLENVTVVEVKPLNAKRKVGRPTKGKK